MTDDPTDLDPDDDQDPNPDNGDQLDKATVQGWIRDALADLVPGKAPKPDPDDDDEPLTIKAIEAAARRAVEEAMEPLRKAAAQKQRAKPKPKAEPTPEPEPSPAKGSPSKLRKMMWGADDD